jgi:hypothetical protein
VLSLFPSEIDRLPRKTIVVILKYIRDHRECTDTTLVVPIAKLEGKVYKQYRNDWLRAVGRYLIRRGFVVADETNIGGGIYFHRNYEITDKGLHFLDRRWILRTIWDEAKDVLGRAIASLFKPT